MAKTVFLRLLWYKPELHCRTHRPECLHLTDVYSSTFVFFFFFCVHDRLHKVPHFCHFSILRTQPSCLYKLKLSLEITDWGYMPHCDKLTDFLEWRSEAFQAFFFFCLTFWSGQNTRQFGSLPRTPCVKLMQTAYVSSHTVYMELLLTYCGQLGGGFDPSLASQLQTSIVLLGENGRWYLFSYFGKENVSFLLMKPTWYCIFLANCNILMLRSHFNCVSRQRAKQMSVSCYSWDHVCLLASLVQKPQINS